MSERENKMLVGQRKKRMVVIEENTKTIIANQQILNKQLNDFGGMFVAVGKMLAEIVNRLPPRIPPQQTEDDTQEEAVEATAPGEEPQS